jgi:hypothetical protein
MTGITTIATLLSHSNKIWILKHTTVKLACVNETETQGRPEKYVSICYESKGPLKARQAAKTSPLVGECQKALNDISTQHTVYWVPGHAGVCGSEIPNKLARGGSIHKFIGPQPSLGVSRQNISNNIKHCVSTWQYEVFLTVLRGRLKNWFWALARIQRPVYCSLTGHNPGSLLAFLPHLTHCGPGT